MNPTALHRWAYEWTGGRIGARLGSGVRAALLTTTGRKTGRSRTVRLANDGNHGRYQRYQARTSRPLAVLVVTPA